MNCSCQGRQRARYVRWESVTYSDDQQHGTDAHESDDGVLEPLFAILEVEPGFCEVAEELGLA